MPNGSLEHHQNNNLILLIFSIFLGKDTSFYDIKKGTNFSFFGQKYQNKTYDVDVDKRWTTTK